MSHTVSYRILNHRPGDPPRVVDVRASPQELQVLTNQGYLVRERFFQGEELKRLQEAMDRLEAQEKERIGLSGSRDFGGLFMRYLMDKDQVFLHMLKFQPFLSVARAMLGPQVKMSMSARISYPGPENQETMWHQHLRYIPKPLPPWFIRPHGMDVLVYLDDADDANGPLCVVPGSHDVLQDEPPGSHFDDLPGQVTLRPPAGTAVMMHSNLWHRAMPTTSQGTKRRLLLIGYTPTWLKTGYVSGKQPENGLTRALWDSEDAETLELLGRSGYM